MNGDIVFPPLAPCPCCAGRYEGQTWDLCDDCLEASLAGQFPHPCRRIWTEADIAHLAALREAAS